MTAPSAPAGLAETRARALDAAAVLLSCFCALILAGANESSGRIHGDETFWVLLLGILGSVALWWRRTHPIAVLVVLTPIGAITDTAAYAGVVILHTLVVQRRTRAVVVVTALSLPAVVLYAVRRPDPSLPLYGELVITAMFLALTIAIGVAVRSRRDLIDSLRQRAEQAEEQARLRADRLRALERERIAREMHDALAHRISMVSLHAGALHIRPDLSAGEVAKAASTIRDSAHQALEDLREILGVLRADQGDGGLRPQPDLRHLDDLLTEARAAGVRVEATDHLNGTPVSASLGRTVYRLVQEGLTNAGKHAPAVPVHLLLERTPDGELHVLVSNRLPVAGSAGVPGAGAGLVGLAERVALIGGRLRHGVRADPDAGALFDLEAWLPWPN
ncbi:histidine kinase [Actinoplanes sp. DH11]|uniref:sensor histidine kinase n=1 Tax=Actinoplanes sp. DH11 TaxID=2857011 RepID=UPI001E2EC3CA|nr:histidine kinase [Actinoplanes sp. DH11]